MPDIIEANNTTAMESWVCTSTCLVIQRCYNLNTTTLNVSNTNAVGSRLSAEKALEIRIMFK